MTRRTRLDSELVRRGLARSRQHAAELVAAGRVLVAGAPATKVATAVLPADPLRLALDGAGEDYVSRGGHKLAGALDFWGAAGPRVEGRRCLDAGASTGGFTDVLLRRGADRVVAVDVGYGQLAWSVRNHPRVRVLERTNVRELTPDLLGGAVAMVVGDLSFISLTLVLPALFRCAEPTADLVLLVKPQFEAGRSSVGRGGVVRDPEVRAAAISRVAAAAWGQGLGVSGVTASELPGPAGNVEYFLWLCRGAPALDPSAVRRAVAEGPA